MSEYLFTLGTNKDLSSLELERFFYNKKTTIENPSEVSLIGSEVALVKTKKEIDIKKTIFTLGGTIKIGKFILKTTEKELTPELLAKYIRKNKSGKTVFGFSLYAGDEKTKIKKLHKQFDKLGMKVKSILRDEGSSARFVISKEPTLSSVIVQKEILKKNGTDFLIVINDDKITLGITEAVQDFATYSKLDYDRPAKDIRSGMIPPKVAEMMINIAYPHPREYIIDPFCGSGTILHAAALLGWKNILGSDISPKAIDNTKKNIEWLALQYKEKMSDVNFRFEVIDAQKISTILSANSIDAIVTEVYLGPPKFEKDLPRIKADLQDLYFRVFEDFKRILKPKAKLVVAFPAWKLKKNIIHLDIRQELLNMNYQFFAEPVIYGRPDARVLREIYFMEN